ncbi:TetR/AcrR family transcriptional regulator [Neptuniibacter sp. QD48_55]|uniref:TetR/AcrR family transcriptional regulator n=1 Tax=Neptuniibacter sp. QD48_55 TaxID=3398212 RepID=UPI0039F45E85
MCPNGNADLTRSLILNAATRIISQDGLQALTAGKLIAEAGVSKGGLYHHFRTMTEVEIEVLQLLSSKLLLTLQGYQAPQSKEEFLDRVESELFDCLISHDETARALFGYVSSSVFNQQIQVLLRQLQDDISLQRLQILQKVSVGTSTASLQNTVQMIATIQAGLMMRFYVSEDPVSVGNYWRACRSSLEGLLGIKEQSNMSWEIVQAPPTPVSSICS